MADFLILQTGNYLLLNTGDKILLSGDHIETTLPLITSDLQGYLGPLEGLSTTLPRIVSSLSGSLGETSGINTTLPLIVSILGGSNTQATTLSLITDALYGIVNAQVGSGLYKIVDGDTHDTYYNKVHSGTTISAEMPEPSVQTYLTHDEEENLIHIAGIRLRAVGAGTLRPKLFTMDSIRSVLLTTLTLASTNNKEQTVLANFKSHRIMLKLFTSAIDEKFDISRIILYIKTLWTQKPQ